MVIKQKGQLVMAENANLTHELSGILRMDSGTVTADWDLGSHTLFTQNRLVSTLHLE